MDKHTYNKIVNEARMKYQELDNRALSGLVATLADRPGAFTKAEREAILRTAASRLWHAK